MTRRPMLQHYGARQLGADRADGHSERRHDISCYGNMPLFDGNKLITPVPGSLLPDPEPPHWTVASVDAIAHFARSYGDDNPIYTDPDAARRSARGGLFAPPLFALSSGIPTEGAEPVTFSGSPDPGIDAERWVLHRRVAEGTRLQREKRLRSMTPGTASYTVVERTVYTDAGLPVATRDRQRRYWLHPPVKAAPSSKGKQDLAAIDAAYAAERRRGAAPRYAVAVGDRLGPMVKGPLTVTDLIDYRAGVGPGPLGGDALRLAWRNRTERPGLYDIDRNGAYDIVERRHWDDHYARELGRPGAYDYSHTRLVWLSHLVDDWMGDGGHLYLLSGTTALGANYTGDTHWLTGVVTATDGNGLVELALSGTNQRGEETCRATAVVLLPRPGTDAVTDDQLAEPDDGL